MCVLPESLVQGPFPFPVFPEQSILELIKFGNPGSGNSDFAHCALLIKGTATYCKFLGREPSIETRKCNQLVVIRVDMVGTNHNELLTQ